MITIECSQVILGFGSGMLVAGAIGGYLFGLTARIKKKRGLNEK